MGKLIYTAITSLDGYIEDPSGAFDWAVPDPELHAYLNELEAPIGTHLYGRRMYETMAVWQDIEGGPEASTEESAYARMWRGLDKVVYSRTLTEVRTPRTRLEPEFDPGAVGELKASTGHDVSVSGPDLAQHAFRAGLVDEVHLFVFPLLVGGGKPGLPRGVRLDLELVRHRVFAAGVVHLHHRVRDTG